MLAPHVSYETVPVDDPADSFSSAPPSPEAHFTSTRSRSRSFKPDASEGAESNWMWRLPLGCLCLALWTVAVVLLVTRTSLSQSLLPAAASDATQPAGQSPVPLSSFPSSLTAPSTSAASLSPLDCYGHVNVDWSAVCESRYWEAVINVLLSTHEQRDHSTASQPRAKDSGTRRLYRVILKLLCGHPIILGTTGTSVSCGLGTSLAKRKADPHLYLRMIHRYLSSIRPLTATGQRTASATADSSQLGYWNGCMPGSGTDTASICLGSIFDSRTFYASQRQVKVRGSLDFFIPPGEDSHPELTHPQYFTSVQYAHSYNLSAIIPDLVLVEYTANDARAVAGRSFGSPNISLEDCRKVKIANMERLLDRIWEFPTAAPLLMNTAVSIGDEVLVAIEEVYRLAQSRHNIPSLDLRRHLGLNSTLSEPARATEAATFNAWVSELIDPDGSHPATVGHITLAIMFSAYFNQLINDLLDTIQHFSALQSRVRSAVVGGELTEETLSERAASLLKSDLSAGFEQPAASHLWRHSASEDAMCAMQWGVTFNRHVLVDNATMSAHLFEFTTQSSDGAKNKWAWTTHSRSAWLDIRLMSFSRGAPVIGFSFAFLCSYSTNMSTSVRVWVSGRRLTDGTAVNMSDVHAINSWWPWRQSTIVTREIPFTVPRDQIAQLTEPVAHFVNDEHNKFALAGVFVRSESTVHASG